ncbi:MAG TPA: hypothetical protein VGA20_04360 [Gemmatimonadales bacterium]
MASGDLLAAFEPAGAQYPSSDYAQFDARNGHHVLDFDGSADESIIWAGWLSPSYDGGGITVEIAWASDGTTGDVDWDVAIETLADGGDDTDSDSFAAANSTDGTTVPGTSGALKYTTVTFTDGADMDSLGAGDRFRLKLTRDAANDTSTDDVQVYGVQITET